jgi:glycine cleavage system H lipoate-binding protein
VSVPKGLYYDRTHTWTFMEQNGTVRTGVDDFLRHITGPVTRIGLKNPGDRITKGEPFLTVIREGKKLVLYSPLTGTIRACNEELAAHPSVLYTDPYSDGWVYRIEPSNWAREIQFLAMAEKYRSWLTFEFTRLRDFLATSLSAHEVSCMPVILQDGGALKEGLLADMGPEVWEDFQNRFLNTGK